VDLRNRETLIDAMTTCLSSKVCLPESPVESLLGSGPGGCL
jgi:hypothetical protein